MSADAMRRAVEQSPDPLVAAVYADALDERDFGSGDGWRLPPLWGRRAVHGDIGNFGDGGGGDFDDYGGGGGFGDGGSFSDDSICGGGGGDAASDFGGGNGDGGGGGDGGGYNGDNGEVLPLDAPGGSHEHDH